MTLIDLPIWARDKKGLAFSDIPVREGGRMPDFCIIGSAKCGTTSLDRYLGAHQDVFVCVPKEPHYFSTPQMLARGDAWYKGLYANARPDQLCGEASTSYTRFPLVTDTAARMYAANPAMKLIYILRDPVARVQSDALQTQKYLFGVLGEDYRNMTLDAFLDMIEDPSCPYYAGIIETSKYDQQLAAFEAHFQSDQILLLTQSELRQNADLVMSKVYDFLGLSNPGPVDDSYKANVTADFFDGSARTDIAARFRKIPGYGLLRSILPAKVRQNLIGAMRKDIPQANTKLSKDRLSSLQDILIPATSECAKRIGTPQNTW